jgi:hypothetical protein
MFRILITIVVTFYSQTLLCQEKKDTIIDFLKKKIEEDSVDNNCIKNYIYDIKNLNNASRINLTESLVSHAFSLKKYSLAYELRLLSIDIGKTDCLILEDSLGQYLRLHNIEKYRTLEKEYYFEYLCLLDKYTPDANKEICFLLHRMIRLDQRTKFEANENRDSTKNDFYWNAVRFQDSVNEILFGQILDEFNYPGKNLVGYPDISIGYILMLHMSTEFQIKYVHLLKKAYDEKVLFSNIPFLIDKILYKCCRKSIYGYWVGEGMAELEKDSNQVNLLLKKLNL